ncbi:hypothetical protein HDV00_009045 [Rhizophlyctis rosea]|nr:hypothetical protein HDV00_009045 [Rhizophlyctis rosea]
MHHNKLIPKYDIIESGAVTEFMTCAEGADGAWASSDSESINQTTVQAGMPEAVAIPELLLQICRNVSSKDLFKLRLVCRHFKDLTRQAYNDRVSTCIRLSLVVVDNRTLLKTVDMTALETGMRIAAADGSDPAKALPRGCRLIHIIMSCRNHILIDGKRLVLQFRPVRARHIMKAITIWDSCVVAFQSTRIRPSPTVPLYTPSELVPLAPPIFRRTMGPFTQCGNIRDGMYGPDFILNFSLRNNRPPALPSMHATTTQLHKTTLHIEDFFVPYSWLNTGTNDSAPPQQPLRWEDSIYPVQPWRRLVRLCRENALEGLLKEMTGDRNACAVRKWLWCGGEERAKVQQAVKTIAEQWLEKLSTFLDDTIKTKQKQVEIVSLMSFPTSPTRTEILHKLRTTAVTNFFTLPLARQYLTATGMEAVGAGDTDRVFEHLVGLSRLDPRPGERKGRAFVERVAGVVEAVETGEGVGRWWERVVDCGEVRGAGRGRGGEEWIARAVEAEV